jgi:hypothetical protein
LRQHGFEPVAVWHDIRTLGQIKDPALTALFRKSDAVDKQFAPDHESQIALQRYIECCEASDSAVMQRIETLVRKRQPILVWGTGTQTQRLLATTELGKASIRAFIDSNANYQGKQLNGVPILAPEDLSNYSEPIVISSRVYQEEIASQIRDSLKLKNDIVRLFDIPQE